MTVHWTGREYTKRPTAARERATGEGCGAVGGAVRVGSAIPP